MGNRLACMSTSAQLRRIKVLHADSGRLSELDEIAKVAELMMDYSNQFVCHAKALHSGQRITPLPADEELKIGELYILLPMRKLHARLSPEDISFLSSAIIKSSGRKRSKDRQSKVSPLPWPGTEPASSLAHRNAVESGIEKSTALSNCFSSSIDSLFGPELSRAGMCKAQRWVPKLKTIAEIAC